MAERQLKLIATFTDQGALKGLKVMNTEMEKTERVAKQASGGMKGFGQPLTDLAAKSATFAGALGIVAVGFVKVYEQAKRGAELEFTAQKFDSLSESIGTTSDALLVEMTQATGKMMSNSEQIALGSQIIDLGLAKNEEMVVRLSRVIAERGLDMQQVIMTFANDSKMRLDALGLSVTDVDTRTKAFQDTGMAYTDAFDLAVIEALEAKIELVGSAADTGVGTLKEFEANLKNIADTGTMLTTAFLVPAAKGFNNIIGGYQGIVAATREQTLAAKENNLEWDQYIESLGIMGPRIQLINILTGNHARELYEEGRRIANVSTELEKFIEKTGLAKEEQYEFSEANYAWAESSFYAQQAMEQAAEGVREYKLSQQEAREETERIKQEMSDLQLFIAGPLGEEYDNFTQKNQDLTTTAEELRAKIVQLGGSEYMTEAQKDDIRDLQWELNNVSTQIKEVDDELENGELNKRKFLAATENLEELRETAWELEQQIRALGGTPYLTDKNRDDLEKYREELDETNAAIAANAAAHDEATKRIVFDMLTQRAAIGGLTSDELKLLNDMALKWGLVDQDTHEATISIDQALTALANGESFAEVEAKIMAIDRALRGIPTTIGVNINVNQTGNLPAIDAYFGPGGTSTGGTDGVFESGGGGPGFEQHGGMVSRGRPYIVGEAGPELFVPRSPGQIISNTRLAENLFGGGGDVININVYSQPGQDVHAVAREVARVIRERG